MEYELISDIWTRKVDFAGNTIAGSSEFVIGNKGYVLGNQSSIYYKKIHFWEYEPGRNYWIQKADFEGMAGFGVVGFTIGNKGYFGTGSENNLTTKEFWEYTPDTATIGPPTIISFFPTSGPVGRTVTINGTNFGASPSDNIVYFGATKAIVTAASNTALTVTVPPVATYQPLSETTTSLFTYSS